MSEVYDRVRGRGGTTDNDAACIVGGARRHTKRIAQGRRAVYLNAIHGGNRSGARRRRVLRAGDYRNAVRYLYLSSLLLLDEQGMLRYDRSRTNREVLRSVSSKPELAVPLHDVIDVFDRVWYGFEALDDKTYQTYVERVDDLRERKE